MKPAGVGGGWWEQPDKASSEVFAKTSVQRLQMLLASRL